MTKILSFIALIPLKSLLLPSASHIVSCFSTRAEIPFRLLHELLVRLAGLKFLQTGLGFSARVELRLGCNFSPADRAEISARLLKQILLKSNCRLHGEGFSPAKRAEKSEKNSCNRNGISARAEKQETIWLALGSRSDFSGIKAIKERILFVVSLISKLR